MKQIYLAVMQQLKQQVPELRWIDLDEGQLDNYTERPPVAFPAALIGISLTKCTDIYGPLQQCVASISVRIAQNIPTQRTNSVAIEQVRQTALERYDLVDSAYKALQAFCTDEFNPLSRTRQNKETRNDGLFVYRIAFQTEFQDRTAE